MASDIVSLDRYNPEKIASGIAERLKQSRLRENLTQSALAKRSGVSLGSLKRFETQHEISLKNLLLLAVALGAIDDFHTLFYQSTYTDLDEIIEEREVKYRKRGRIND